MKTLRKFFRKLFFSPKAGEEGKNGIYLVKRINCYDETEWVYVRKRGLQTR